MVIKEKSRILMEFRKSWLSHWKPSCYSFDPVPPTKVEILPQSEMCCLPTAFSSPHPLSHLITSPPGTHGNKGHTNKPVRSRAEGVPSQPFLLSWSFCSCLCSLILSGVCSVSQPAIDYLLSHGTGNLVGIVVGGVGEALQSVPNTTTLILQKRKGFVRTALQHG